MYATALAPDQGGGVRVELGRWCATCGLESLVRLDPEGVTWVDDRDLSPLSAREVAAWRRHNGADFCSVRCLAEAHGTDALAGEDWARLFSEGR